MASTSETGHAKNVANFEQLISFCTSYGADYNPTKAALTIASLNTLQTAAKASLHTVNSLAVAFNNAGNARIVTFEPLRKLCTRVLGAFIVTDATSQMVADAKTINRKIQGKRAKAIETPTNPDTPPPATISASQQSFDQLIEHFDRLIELVKSEFTYAPNETDLTVAALEAYLNLLQADNSVVVSTFTSISNARIARDQILYKDKTGLVPIALDVKIYLKSVFGASSEKYKQVNRIPFKVIQK